MGHHELVTTPPNHLLRETPVLGDGAAFDIAEITAEPIITRVAQLIDLFESLCSPNPVSSQITGWAFRGQPEPFESLKPSLPRGFETPSLTAAEIIESRLIAAFRIHYFNLPETDPKNSNRNREMPTREMIGTNHDLRCLSVMQHYDIPTRLLDWTTNLWKALYFACASAPGRNAELWYYDRAIFDFQRNEMPEYWALMDKSVNAVEEPVFLGTRKSELLVELDQQISPRMKTQQTHHTVSAHPFRDHAQLIWALCKKYPAPEDAFRFRRIIIEASCKDRVLRYLAEEENITASTIFPDVAGLGCFLRWQFDSLRTMLF